MNKNEQTTNPGPDKKRLEQATRLAPTVIETVMDADLRSRANKDPLSAHPAVNPNAAGSIYGAAAEADQAAHPQNTPEYSVAEGFYGPDDGLIDSSASYPEAMSAHLAIGGVTKEEDGSYDLQINNTHHHVNERGVPLDIQ